MTPFKETITIVFGSYLCVQNPNSSYFCVSHIFNVHWLLLWEVSFDLQILKFKRCFTVCQTNYLPGMVSNLLFQNSGRLSLEDFWGFKATLGYVGNPCLKNNKITPNFSKSKQINKQTNHMEILIQWS